MSNLPADGATTRLHRLYLLVEHCASFSDGCTETQLIKYGLGLGLIASTIMKYLSDLGPNGMDMLTRIGNRYHVSDWNYIVWAEKKGFREPVYVTRCHECHAQYGSTLENCPKCKAENVNLNEPRGYTHIQVDSIPETNPELTTDPDTHTHEETSAEENLPREERVKEGRQAEKRVVELLGKFGSARLGKGRGGEPDVFFESSRGNYAVEVKSVENQVKTNGDKLKIGSVPLSRKQWVSLCEFAGDNDLVPLMIVEVKINGAQNQYHFIPREMVDHKVEATDSKHIRISVHDLPMMSLHSYREGVPLVGQFQL